MAPGLVIRSQATKLAHRAEAAGRATRLELPARHSGEADGKVRPGSRSDGAGDSGLLPARQALWPPGRYLTPKIEDRAVELQSVLAERGQHRAPSIPDLLIAATAELSELTVLHLDKDFDLIAEVTGQKVERLNLGPPYGEGEMTARSVRPRRCRRLSRIGSSVAPRGVRVPLRARIAR